MGGLRETWELWEREFSHGLSPVMSNGICCHHLFCFSAYLPMCNTRQGALKRGNRGHFNESKMNAVQKSTGNSWKDMCGLCLAERKMQQDAEKCD